MTHAHNQAKGLAHQAVKQRTVAEWASNRLWRLAVIVRNGLKRVGALGVLDPISTWAGPRLLPPPRTEVTVPLPMGLSITVPAGFPSYRNYATGVYESDVTSLISSRLQSGMSAVDVGANIGYYTVTAARLVGPAGHVYAFEPDPEAYRYLERNVADNNCSNVTTVASAVGNVTGTVEFVQAGPERGYIQERGQGNLPVASTTLDAYFSGLGWPALHLIKIDVEGHEGAVLLGMVEVVRQNPQLLVVMEMNSQAARRADRSTSSIVETLTLLGFTHCYLIERRREVTFSWFLSSGRAVHNVLLSRSSPVRSSIDPQPKP
jgi:FkbM family methyltransferase